MYNDCEITENKHFYLLHGDFMLSLYAQYKAAIVHMDCIYSQKRLLLLYLGFFSKWNIVSMVTVYHTQVVADRGAFKIVACFLHHGYTKVCLKVHFSPHLTFLVWKIINYWDLLILSGWSSISFSRAWYLGLSLCASYFYHERTPSRYNFERAIPPPTPFHVLVESHISSFFSIPLSSFRNTCIKDFEILFNYRRVWRYLTETQRIWF